MPRCTECGEEVSMPFNCDFCGGDLCSDHRLPENHLCVKADGPVVHPEDVGIFSTVIGVVLLPVFLAIDVLQFGFQAVVRILTTPSTLAVSVIGALLVAGLLGVDIPIAEMAAGVASGIGSLGSEPAPDSDGVGDSGGVDADYNQTDVERLIFQKVNAIRDSEGMDKYHYNSKTTSVSEAHAIDMAKNEYFSHTSQDGETQEERYAFCDGGENIAQTWVEKNIVSDSGFDRYTSEEELAEGVVTQWMNSEGHRERGILGEWWDSSGVGVAMTDSGKVYVSMGFCT